MPYLAIVDNFAIYGHYYVTNSGEGDTPTKLDGIKGDYSEHFIITQLIIYSLTTSEAVNNETHWIASDHNIHCSSYYHYTVWVSIVFFS